MNDIGELKQFVVVHARAQRIPSYASVLSAIEHDDGDRSGSWVDGWIRAAERFERSGDLLSACRAYNLARFPFVDGPARAEALRRCVDTFDRWRKDHPSIAPLAVAHDGGTVRCWTAGLSRTDRKPLLLVMAGIVTVKEQWGPVLRQAARLGMAGLVAELPGVGENTAPYDEKSWRMIPALLDAVADGADVSRTYAVTPSFAGHLALRAAVDDHRIRGVVAAGAPINAFFTDREWFGALPRVTVDTLAHLTGSPVAGLADRLRPWALTVDQLDALDIPVAAAVSTRDEIIPPADRDILRRHVRQLSVLTNDDVHGAPDHVAETQLWTVASVLRMRAVRSPQRAVINLAFRAARVRGRLTRPR
ncbi:alpha/beta hydrolase [Micromonospora sp. CA-240977]|uniref:alpha/beta hydrolase n=1 Tax=Micromonospora sp. CA-240977 TaxID=3239957 RepID=UPI003D8E9536